MIYKSYKSAFESLKEQIQMLLTDYEEYDNTHTEMYDRIENAEFLYGNIVKIINDTEGWEILD